MELEEISRRFSLVYLNEQQARDSKAVREELALTAAIVNGIIPDGREKSLVITHLEEAAMWAYQAIARSNG